MITVDRKLWLTHDKTRLVEDGDPAAAFLWAVPGDEVTEAQAREVGYKPAKGRTRDEPEAEAKAQEPAQNKAKGPSENK